MCSVVATVPYSIAYFFCQQISFHDFNKCESAGAKAACHFFVNQRKCADAEQESINLSHHFKAFFGQYDNVTSDLLL